MWEDKETLARRDRGTERYFGRERNGFETEFIVRDGFMESERQKPGEAETVGEKKGVMLYRGVMMCLLCKALSIF